MIGLVYLPVDMESNTINKIYQFSFSNSQIEIEKEKKYISHEKLAYRRT